MGRTLERALKASRTGLQWVEAETQATALKSKVMTWFPAAPAIPEIVCVRSRERRAEYFKASANLPFGALVLDLRLQDTLHDLAAVQSVHEIRNAGRLIALVLAADGFRKEAAFAHYHLCVKSAAPYGLVFDNLARRRTREMQDFVFDFIGFHEFGHLALDQDLPWTRPIIEVVARARDQYLELVKWQLANPSGGLPGFTHTAGTPIDQLEEGVVEANLRQVIDTLSNNTSLITEAACDWIACLAMLSSTIEVQCLSKQMPQRSPRSWRVAGDCLFLCSQVSRLVSFVAMYQDVAANLVRTDAAFRNPPSQIEIHARFNILRNLATGYQKVLEQIAFDQGHGFPVSADPESVIAAFSNSLVRDARNFDEAVFSLVNVVEPLRDPTSFESNFRRVMGREMHSDLFDECREADVVRNELFY